MHNKYYFLYLSNYKRTSEAGRKGGQASHKS
ncbi:KGG domain-containing protein [Gluconobacter sphaericus]